MEDVKPKPIDIKPAIPQRKGLPPAKNIGSIKLKLGDIQVEIDGRPDLESVNTAWHLLGGMHEKFMDYYAKPKAKENEIG